MKIQEADSKCIVLQSVICVKVEEIMLKSNDKVDACSHFHACLIHVVSLELSRLKKSSAVIKRLLSSLFGHDLFNLNFQAVRVGGLTQSFKYALKRHCYDNSIYYICQNYSS